MSMKWHNFLIYFALWTGGIVNIQSAFTYMTGAHYGDAVDRIYRLYGSLKAADAMMGVACIVLGVLMIVTRFALDRYKASGLKRLIGVYVMNLIFLCSMWLLFPLSPASAWPAI